MEITSNPLHDDDEPEEPAADNDDRTFDIQTESIHPAEGIHTSVLVSGRKGCQSRFMGKYEESNQQIRGAPLFVKKNMDGTPGMFLYKSGKSRGWNIAPNISDINENRCFIRSISESGSPTGASYEYFDGEKWLTDDLIEVVDLVGTSTGSPFDCGCTMRDGERVSCIEYVRYMCIVAGFGCAILSCCGLFGYLIFIFFIPQDTPAPSPEPIAKPTFEPTLSLLTPTTRPTLGTVEPTFMPTLTPFPTVTMLPTTAYTVSSSHAAGYVVFFLVCFPFAFLVYGRLWFIVKPPPVYELLNICYDACIAFWQVMTLGSAGPQPPMFGDRIDDGKDGESCFTLGCSTPTETLKLAGTVSLVFLCWYTFWIGGFLYTFTFPALLYWGYAAKQVPVLSFSKTTVLSNTQYDFASTRPPVEGKERKHGGTNDENPGNDLLFAGLSIHSEQPEAYQPWSSPKVLTKLALKPFCIWVLCFGNEERKGCLNDEPTLGAMICRFIILLMVFAISGALFLLMYLATLAATFAFIVYQVLNYLMITNAEKADWTIDSLFTKKIRALICERAQTMKALASTNRGSAINEKLTPRPSEGRERKQGDGWLGCAIVASSTIKTAFALFVSFLKLTLNIYLILKSVFSSSDESVLVEKKLKFRMVLISEMFQRHAPSWLASLYTALFSLWRRFDFINIDFTAEVTCQAAQGPVYLALDFLLILLLIIIYDSTLYVFLKVCAEDLDFNRAEREGEMWWGGGYGIQQYTSWKQVRRHAVTFAWKYAVSGVEATLKIGMQLLLSNLVIGRFFPYWDGYSKSCNNANQSEWYLLAWTTAMAYTVFPWSTLILLNTFVWGYGPNSTDSDSHAHRRKSYLYTYLGSRHADSDIRSDDPSHFQTSDSLYTMGHEMTSSLASWCYLVVYKLLSFLKLTIGWWDTDLVETFEIKRLAATYNLNPKADTKHQSLLICIGESHSLLWQIFPFGVPIAKAAEALNASPIFVTLSFIPEMPFLIPSQDPGLGGPLRLAVGFTKRCCMWSAHVILYAATMVICFTTNGASFQAAFWLWFITALFIASESILGQLNWGLLKFFCLGDAAENSIEKQKQKETENGSEFPAETSSAEGL